MHGGPRNLHLEGCRLPDHGSCLRGKPEPVRYHDGRKLWHRAGCLPEPPCSRQRDDIDLFAPAFGGTGTDIATNTNYLESLLDAGNDVVMGVYVAGNDWHNGVAESGAVDVQILGNGNPAGAYGGHAMLMVGYSKAGNYFIFKNSWGTAVGHSGYFFLTYEYLQTYAKYGYVLSTATPS